MYVERTGEGPELLLIHGWGMHGGIFRSLVPHLSAHYRLHIIDLPGHGRSPLPAGGFSLESLAEAIAAVVPDSINWLGWSLGGRIALAAAARGLPIQRLILVGSNPCFTQRADWPHGMAIDKFTQFAHAVQQDWPSALQRFLAIQTRGSSNARDELRLLRQEIFAHGEPHAMALHDGLKLLHEVDLRSVLPQIKQDTLLIHGTRDTLSPLAAAEYATAQLPHGKLVAIEGAGHAPFISHTQEFLAALEHFLS
ncbi:MAG: pimeloyl-ACP methyl ester esterase BioH [Thiohalomonadaceae bacterium]|jgi:pimeloyl-[acyl-carrier protein] methyl ester esterase